MIFKFRTLSLLIVVCGLLAPADASAQSVARQWNETLLTLIRIDFPAPTVHARNLYHSSAAMYDAWATYDSIAGGVFFTEKNSADNVEEARNEAISYAAYRVLSQRYQLSTSPVASQAILDNLMTILGYDIGVIRLSSIAWEATGDVDN